MRQDTMSKFTNTIKDIARGGCMAVSDCVPGVSGGTIAFILGFYEKFINSIDDFLLGSLEKKKAAFPFLFKMGIGWVLCFSLCALLLSAFFKTNIYALCSFFIGLTAVSIPVIIWGERATLKGKYYWIIFTLIGAAIVPLFSQLMGIIGTIDITQMSVPLGFYLIGSGIISISVMVLPGISGSTFLLILGLYVPLISGISNLLHGDFSSLPALIIFALGVIIGFALCCKAIRFCFNRFRAQTIYLIIGLLLGSFYAIIKGPESVGPGSQMMTFSTFSIGFCLLGAVIMFILGIALAHREKRTKN